MEKLSTLIITAILLTSCASTHKAGVIYEGKNARVVSGNARHFQYNHDLKLRKDSLKLAKQ